VRRAGGRISFFVSEPLFGWELVALFGPELWGQALVVPLENRSRARESTPFFQSDENEMK
jgi:hypothetical protein